MVFFSAPVLPLASAAVIAFLIASVISVHCLFFTITFKALTSLIITGISPAIKPIHAPIRVNNVTHVFKSLQSFANTNILISPIKLK